MKQTRSQPLRVAVVGGGWAGLATAVQATQLGCQVKVFEASRHWGGRARALPQPYVQAKHITHLDNGQHILLGAYATTLGLMQTVGVPVESVLQPAHLSLQFADGSGLHTPPWASGWPAPLDLLAAIACAKGWDLTDKAALLASTTRWRLKGFMCPPEWTVKHLCHGLPQKVMDDMIDPLCVAALNTPTEQASAVVFLRVLQDALLGPGWGRFKASTLLLPRTDLGALFPVPAVAWLQKNGTDCRTGQRVETIQRRDTAWHLKAQEKHVFDHVVLACPPEQAARLVANSGSPANAWVGLASALRHEAIATVYLQAPQNWPWPAGNAMLALRNGPAQFAFDRGQLGGPPGLIALVASTCSGDKDTLENAIRLQAERQLGLRNTTVVRTVVEKRATFACTAGLQRPGASIAPGLWAAGEYVAGPYPGTLESAVRSGLQAAQAIAQSAL